MDRRYLGVLLVLLAPGFLHAELTCSSRPLVPVEDVRGGTLLVQKFPLRNTGQHTIEVLDVHPSCGCLKPRLQKRLFQAGEEDTLELVVNTLTQPAGEHRWNVTVKYHEAGEDKEVVLGVTGKVVPELLLEPAALILNTDTTCAHDLVLNEKRPTALVVKSIETTRSELTAQADPVHKKEDGTWSRTIHVKLSDALPPGRYEEMVQIFTTDPDFQELKFPVTLIKRPRQAVLATPAVVSFSGIQGEPLPARIVLLAGEGDGSVRIERIEVGDAAIRCSSAVGPGKHSTLRIQVDGGQVSQEMQSEVRVFVVGSEQPVRIPVVVTLGR